ncbi:RagB/SusD family nutrient uptake outer membrane protein [Flavivirga sp. 57AJ16]|uniref:RagB/SusD family nutrient uptake outer membrane protein n=1 Tax=Flavivirga sp. 57AJ16 TaxID=3025307 RepID=UPI002365B7C0|nr:RagB/SusD family nutrient uptake outer membrane protein [Flavivirga sp. 57AJ16]MDD7885102.1 RagB/SusD family nutrient uptake outer membrane protein [Flavivirga sp. 57AJ16]
MQYIKHIAVLSVRNVLILCLLALLAVSCEEFVDTQFPVDKISEEQVFENNESLVSALRSVYGRLANGASLIEIYPVLFADELIVTNAGGSTQEAQENSYSDATDYGYFSYLYNAIYSANAILKNLENPSPKLSTDVVNQVLGETFFLRAYSYFLLVNFYGDVPYITETDPYISGLQPRDTEAFVYENIEQDLLDALTYLDNTYPETGKFRINSHVVKTLLAKVYLYQEEWSSAESYATQVISAPEYELEPDLLDVFTAGSTETLWQFWNENNYVNITASYVPFDVTNVFYRLRPTLVNSFEAEDQRLDVWIGEGTDLNTNTSVYFPYKYRLRNADANRTEFLILFRLAELYLIRSEANANLDTPASLEAAVDDLETIRLRAGISTPLIASTKTEVLNVVYTERRHELMFENANRWFDLIRTDRATTVLSAIKPNFKLFTTKLPIPNAILEKNPNLEQTTGYNN